MSAAAIVAALADAPARCRFYRTFDGEDADAAVKAWNGRTGALAAIEVHGSFFDAEKNAPKAADLLDTYEESFRKVEATTAQGVLAKLWTALSHLGPAPNDSWQRGDEASAMECHAEHDAIRRADTKEVAAFIDNWDFGEEVLFSAIRDLERLIGESH